MNSIELKKSSGRKPLPFKSDAQRRKFAELVKDGKMSQSVFDEWNSGTPKNIPDRVKPKGKTKTGGRKR